jgi:hypothetical protein
MRRAIGNLVVISVPPVIKPACDLIGSIRKENHELEV